MVKLARRLKPTAGAVLVGALVLTSGTAGAATGAALILGRSNSADRPTGLTNTGKGPALRLKAESGAPLSVAGNDRRVRSLNADLLDGRSSRAFKGLFLSGGSNSPDGGAAPERTYVVPRGVTKLHIELRGGGGAGGSGEPAGGGGQGAFVDFVLQVAPGQRLAVRPGDAGYAEEGLVITNGRRSAVTDVATGARIAARGGAAGKRADAPAGTCSTTSGGRGGDLSVSSLLTVKITLLAVQEGRRGAEGCVGNQPGEWTDGAGGGVPGVAGSGGRGDELGTSGQAGYVLIKPVG